MESVTEVAAPTPIAAIAPPAPPAPPAFDRTTAKAELERLEDALLSYISSLKKQPGVDQRALATAITNIQQGVMWAGVGIFANKKTY